MEFKTFIFYFLAVIMVFAALRVITSRNPVQAALFLVLTFFNALLSGSFSWEYFLTAPLVFILWIAVAAGLLF